MSEGKKTLSAQRTVQDGDDTGEKDFSNIELALREHLANILDEAIEELEVTTETGTDIDEDTGIEVFLGSGTIIKDVESELTQQRKPPTILPKRRREDKPDKEKLKEAAVTTEWVLQQSAQ